MQRIEPLPAGGVACCICCGARLHGNPKGGIDTPVALSISSLILFLAVNSYPLLTMKVAGQSQQTTLTGASWTLYQAEMPELAVTMFAAL